MVTLGMAELQRGLFDRVKDAEGGARLVVARHGKPVAALVPLSDIHVLGWLQSHARELLEQREP